MRKLNIFLTVLFLSVVSLKSDQVTAQASRSSKRLYQKAMDAYEVRDYAQTISILDKAILKSPNFALAWFFLAQTHRELSQDSIAIVKLSMALSLDDSMYKRGWLELAELLWESGDYSSGLVALDSVVKKHRELKRYKWVKAGLQFSFNAVSLENNHDMIAPLVGDVNTHRPEYFPTMVLAGDMMVFTKLVQSRNSPTGQEEFFSSVLIHNAWRDVSPLKGINTLFNEGAPSISGDGNTLVFTSCSTPRDGFGDRIGVGSCDLFESHYDQATESWSLGENIGAPNTISWESQPTLSSDGNFLVFARALHVRGMGSDLFGSVRGDDGLWGKAFPLPGKINTPYEEESPFLHPDGKTIYFSSNGHPGLGGLDIFVSRKLDNGEWGAPENLGFPLNTYNDENSLMVEPNGVFAIFASDRSNSAGDLDLLRVELPPESRALSVKALSGHIVDDFTGMPLRASLNLVDMSTGLVLTSIRSSLDGFTLPLPVNGRYSFEVSCEGYMFNIAEMFAIDSNSKGHHVVVRLKKINAGETLSLTAVRFTSGSAALDHGYQTDLVLLASWLTSNQTTSVEIVGHTDNVGSAAANLTLSEDRASAVVDFLITSGISSDRLSSSGRGDQVPVVTNATAQGKAVNRRVEIVVNER